MFVSMDLIRPHLQSYQNPNLGAVSRTSLRRCLYPRWHQLAMIKIPPTMRLSTQQQDPRSRLLNSAARPFTLSHCKPRGSSHPKTLRTCTSSSASNFQTPRLTIQFSRGQSGISADVLPRKDLRRTSCGRRSREQSFLSRIHVNQRLKISEPRYRISCGMPNRETPLKYYTQGLIRDQTPLGACEFPSRQRARGGGGLVQRSAAPGA